MYIGPYLRLFQHEKRQANEKLNLVRSLTPDPGQYNNPNDMKTNCRFAIGSKFQSGAASKVGFNTIPDPDDIKKNSPKLFVQKQPRLKFKLNITPSPQLKDSKPMLRKEPTVKPQEMMRHNYLKLVISKNGPKQVIPINLFIPGLSQYERVQTFDVQHFCTKKHSTLK